MPSATMYLAYLSAYVMQPTGRPLAGSAVILKLDWGTVACGCTSVRFTRDQVPLGISGCR